MPAYPYPQNSITIGGRTFTALSSLIHLKARVSSGNATGTFTLASKVTAGGYTPSGTKSFRGLAIRLTVITAVSTSGVGFGYQDTDLGFQSNTSPTNGKQVGALASNVQFQFSIHSMGVADYLCNMLCPNAKYIYIGNTAGTTGEYCADLFGYEE